MNNDTHSKTYGLEFVREHGFGDRKIMMIDDEPINLRITHMQLAGCGLTQFVGLSEAHEATRTIRKEQPDCLLLDLQLSQYNGLDILKSLRTDDQIDYLPIVVITADFEPTTRQTAIEFGADDFLTKPVDQLELVLRVGNCLRLKQRFDFERTKQTALIQENQTLTDRLANTERELAAHFQRLCCRTDREEWLAERIRDLSSLLFAPHNQDSAGEERSSETFGTANQIAYFASCQDATNEGANYVRRWLDDTNASALRELVRHIRMSTHERWDGTGNPLRIEREEIPLAGRVAAIVEAFVQSHQAGCSFSECFEIVSRQAGSAFDPQVIDTLRQNREQIAELFLRSCPLNLPAEASDLAWSRDDSMSS